MQNQSTKIQTICLLWSLYLFTGYGRSPITLDCTLTSPAILTCLNYHMFLWMWVESAFSGFDALRFLFWKVFLENISVHIDIWDVGIWYPILTTQISPANFPGLIPIHGWNTRHFDPFCWLTKKSQGGDISSHFTSLASRCFSGSAGDGGLSLGDGSRRCTERGEERVHRRWGAVGARAMVDWRDPRSKMVNWRGFSIIAMRKTKCCISLKWLYTHTHIYLLLHIYIYMYIQLYSILYIYINM